MRDPKTAPPRPDLTFLKRRTRPDGRAAGGGVDYTRGDRAARSDASQPIDYTRHASARRAGDVASAPSRTASPPSSTPPSASPPSTPPAGAPPASSSSPASGSSADARPRIDFSRPDRSPAASTPATAGVDYRRPGRGGGNSLDLSEGSAPPAASATRPPAVTLPRFHGPHVAAGDQLLLGRDTPSATLTRVQSGVGRLTIEAICSPGVGDLRLGALYQLRSGGTSSVQLAGGNRFAPSSRRPVIVASREEYEELAVDLRQIRDIERIGVYAFSESRAPLTWGGTLVVTTFGGGRIELPLETLAPGSVAMLVSLYNLAGELVVRTEMETIDGDIREVARTYGYDRITWRDDRSPVD